MPPQWVPQIGFITSSRPRIPQIGTRLAERRIPSSVRPQPVYGSFDRRIMNMQSRLVAA